MANYTYPTPTGTLITIGSRDLMVDTDIRKVIRGVDFDPEFAAIAVASASKMNTTNPTFTGTLSGGNIDGGTY